MVSNYWHQANTSIIFLCYCCYYCCLIICFFSHTCLENEIKMYTVFQKSDAKIQITITTAHLIRINYPLNTFNYCLSGTNIANFNKIHHIVSEQQLFTQVAQLSQRDRAAGWVINGQKWKTGMRDNIYGQYRSIFHHCDVFGQQRNRNRRKKTQNKGCYAV